MLEGNILLIDTETTGFPLYGHEHPADAGYQPRMCALSMALLDHTGEVMAARNFLVKPEGWPLGNELFMDNLRKAQAVHGLSLERLEAEGEPIGFVRDMWNDLYSLASYTCGYNLWFDHKIVRGEWKRLGFPIPFREKQGICLMKAARAHLGLSKNIKLADAVQRLLGIGHAAAHTADGDVAVSVLLFQHLLARNAIHAEDQPESKNKPQESSPVHPAALEEAVMPPAPPPPDQRTDAIRGNGVTAMEDAIHGPTSEKDGIEQKDFQEASAQEGAGPEEVAQA
jgi:DNA polymerase III epsilon subunit-like protein